MKQFDFPSNAGSKNADCRQSIQHSQLHHLLFISIPQIPALKMDESTLRRKVQRKSKIRGYSIKLDALAEIVSFASRFDGCEDDAIDLVLDHLHDESCNAISLSLSLSFFFFFFLFHTVGHFIPSHGRFRRFFATMAVQSSIIDKDAVHRVVSILLAADEAGEECPDTSTSTSALCIIDAFDISKFRYDPIKKIFYMYVFPPCIFI